MIQHLFHQVGYEKDQWAQLAAAVLAHSSQMARWRRRCAKAPASSAATGRGAPGLVLLVLVLHAGVNKQQMINL